MNKLQSYFIASVLYVMTHHAFAQGTVTIYLPGEQQTLSVGPVENVVQLVTQPQLRDRLWWPGALLTDSAAKAKALKDGTVAKLAMRQPFVLFKGLTFQKLCL
ncbi:capsule biosynthesis GfcC D2 domain-containing protein, partial [Escherichia coli]